MFLVFSYCLLMWVCFILYLSDWSNQCTPNVSLSRRMVGARLRIAASIRDAYYGNPHLTSNRLTLRPRRRILLDEIAIASEACMQQNSPTSRARSNTLGSHIHFTSTSSTRDFLLPQTQRRRGTLFVVRFARCIYKVMIYRFATAYRGR